MNDNYKTTSIRLTPELHKRLRTEADKYFTSINSILCQIINHWIESRKGIPAVMLPPKRNHWAKKRIPLILRMPESLYEKFFVAYHHECKTGNDVILEITDKWLKKNEK
jgi:hypothetical protein